MNGREQQWLGKINECFLGFTPDPDWNIRRITDYCGEMMGADCALYNRLLDGMLHSLARWNEPPDFKHVDRPDGHICHDVIKNGGRQVFVARDLHLTGYAVSDPNVSAYGLKTYIGVPVNCNNCCVGSLCVVYQKDYSPGEEEKNIMQIFAAALGIEEDRRLEAKALRKAKEDLEMRVEERTAELERVNEQLRIDNLERQQAEESLKKSQTILNKVFESIPDLLVVVKRDLRVVRSNWRGVYESAPDEIRVRSPFCYKVIHPGQDKPCEPCYALEVFRTGKPMVLEKISPENNTVEIRAYPVFDDSGEVILVTEHVRDITERKQSEMEILRMNVELREKTRQLQSAQEELMRRENLAMLGRLAGNIGHELLNPLGVMNNSVYYLKTVLAGADETVKEYLNIIKHEIDSSTQIITDLIKFAGISVPQPRLANAAELIGMGLVKCVPPEKIELRLDVPEGLTSLEVDPEQIAKILQNLISNAVQAMPDGGVLSIGAKAVRGWEGEGAGLPGSGHGPENGFIVISVADTGEGIPEENLEKIFQPLFSTRLRGIGLGLSISRRLAELNAGRIDVESRAGEGSTFTLTLPAGKSMPCGL